MEENKTIEVAAAQGAVPSNAVVIVAFSLNQFAGAISGFVKETFERFEPLQDVKRIPLGSLILFSIIEEEVETVHLKVFEGLSDDKTTIKYKDGAMTKEVKSHKPLTLENIFLITDHYAGALKGPHKKEIQSMVAELMKDVDTTVRIGGLYFKTKEDGFSKDGEAIQKIVADQITKLSGMDVKFRWSDNCGKVQKIAGAGFNILLVNPSNSVFRELFRKGAHHYSKNQMFVFEANEDLKDVTLVTDAEDKFKTIINPSFGVTEAPDADIEKVTEPNQAPETEGVEGTDQAPKLPEAEGIENNATGTVDEKTTIVNGQKGKKKRGGKK